jgi:hypothetical protein
MPNGLVQDPASVRELAPHVLAIKDMLKDLKSQNQHQHDKFFEKLDKIEVNVAKHDVEISGLISYTHEHETRHKNIPELNPVTLAVIISLIGVIGAGTAFALKAIGL